MAFNLSGLRYSPVKAGAWCFRGKDVASSRVGVLCVSRRRRTRPTNVSYAKGLQNKSIEKEIQTTEWHEETHELHDPVISEVHGTDLQQMVDQIRAMLRSMNDGEISISAYDTAWVAQVPRLDGCEGPQFPTTVDWIINNQLPDGSWGDAKLFSAYDRIINTLACVVALTKWSLELDKCKRGLDYLHQNMWRLAEEDPETMLIGFEIAFPSLIEAARSLGVDFPYDHHALQDIYANRKVKLERIPKDMMHRFPTPILFSLEGMPGLDWEKLLKLKTSNGSFLYSPSATAYALMQTGDMKCFEYIDRIVKKFNGGVPNVYPVDLFEHIWVVDRLQRLGISRYFEREIKQCVNYVNRYWTEQGICWARNSNVNDVDDTSMAFRLLRLHGFNVSPSVFKNFEKDGEFFCCIGQSTQAVTGMYNLNRASQICFPGEDVLRRARIFSHEFLREREAQGTLSDKWIITKDLPGEVQYTLNFPWYASLPRVEARTFLGHYGGGDDVWIGKALYRMPLVNNDAYLELARKDFNRCQALHQLEWQGLQKWFNDNGLDAFGVTREDVLRAYFLAVSCIFEPSRAIERLAWARVSVLANAISTHLRRNILTNKSVESFVCNSLCEENDDSSWLKGVSKEDILLRALHQLIESLTEEANPINGGTKYIRNILRRVWMEWMKQINNQDGTYGKSNSVPQGSCMIHDKQTCLLLVQVIEICAGRIGEDESIINRVDSSSRFSQLASTVCDSLHHKMLLSQDMKENKEIMRCVDEKIELGMQNLAQLLLRQSNGESSDKKTKETIFNIVKSCYYIISCPSHMVEEHISKVIFERVI